MGSCCEPSESKRIRVYKPVKETYVEEVDTKEVGDFQKLRKTVNGYVMLKTIGRGVVGKVKVVERADTKQTFAAKIYDKKRLFQKNRRTNLAASKNNSSDVLRELELFKHINHPNVVSAVEIINDPDSRFAYLVMEYVPGGPLMTCTSLYALEDAARSYFCDLVRGVEYLHSLYIVHRDIKPDNLLHCPVTKQLKICDFSSAQIVSPLNPTITTSGGSPLFFAPEICFSFAEEPPQAFPVDIWAMGLTLYCWYFGVFPFEGSNNLMIMSNKIINFQLNFPSTRGGRNSSVDASSTNVVGGNNANSSIRNCEGKSIASNCNEETDDDTSHDRSINKSDGEEDGWWKGLHKDLGNTRKEFLQSEDEEKEKEDYVHFKDFMWKILDKNPISRITIEEMKEHPWLSALLVT